MWIQVISLCWSLLLVINTTTNAHGGGDDDDDDVPEYEIHDLHDSEIAGNREHLKEHLDHLDEKDMENMSDEELEFHYFNSHDYNNDLRLDGLEILSSLMHSFDEEHVVGPLPPKEHLEKMSAVEMNKLHENRNEKLISFMTGLIDNVMERSDKDNDGYLEYAEYMDARQKQKEQYRKNVKSEDSVKSANNGKSKDNMKSKEKHKHKHKHVVKGH